DLARAAGQWAQALAAYRQALADLPRMPVLHHNIALCELALASPAQALVESEAAIGLDPKLWQAHLVRAKALRSLGRAADALAALDALPRGEQPIVELERISLGLYELGDAAGSAQAAAALHARFPDMPAETAADVDLNQLVASLYDPGDEAAEDLSRRFAGYAARHLGAQRIADVPAPVARRKRKRIGVISPQLFASPVYFFGI